MPRAARVVGAVVASSLLVAACGDNGAEDSSSDAASTDASNSDAADQDGAISADGAALDSSKAPAYVCTTHVTTSTFAASFTAAGAGAVLCLAPGSYGNWAGGNKPSQVVITPDLSAGGTAPIANATGGVNGNVIFAGLNFRAASFIKLDGMTFTDDVQLPWGTTTGNVHDITIRNSLFRAHLEINDTAMNAGNIVIDYNLFPGDSADCINGPEGRIQLGNSGHSATPDGVIIENNDIGGVSSVQCDGIQSGGYGPQILGNWFHDYHFQNSAHTDGIQLYGSQSTVIKGNFFYNVPDGIVAYDGMENEDVENNIAVNDSAKDNGASPNQVDFLANVGTSTIKHNTVVGGLSAFNSPEGNITLGTKGAACTGLVINDNVATSISNGSGGGNCTYTADYDLLQQGGGTGTHNVVGAPTYVGGDCGNLTTDPPGKCADKWGSFLLTSSSPGHHAADDGTDMGASGAGPVTPGGP